MALLPFIVWDYESQVTLCALTAIMKLKREDFALHYVAFNVEKYLTREFYRNTLMGE
jgi:hypothetical protein